MSFARLRIAAVRMTTWVGLGAAPVALAVMFESVFISRRPDRSDFGTFWLAGRTVLHGGNPYPVLASLPDVADDAAACARFAVATNTSTRSA